MAQATLLDPSAIDAQPQEAAGDTDEMLSKLAGDEIDHLLAEAEAGRTSPTLPVPKVEPTPTSPPPDQTAAQLDDLISGMDEVPTGPPEKPHPEVAAAAPVEAQAAPVVETPPEVAEEARLEVLAAELQVDQPGATAAIELEAKAPAPLPPPPVVPLDDHIPLVLWPLIAINAPFASCPKSMRRLLGKVAVVTLINAVGVFVYVTLLKKHH